MQKERKHSHASLAPPPTVASLTDANIGANDGENGYDRLKETNEFQDSFRDKLREKALRIYRSELNLTPAIDLGLHGVTRAALRVLCKEAVLESSKAMKRRYSHSAMSSSIHSLATTDNNAVSALKLLQKERLIVSRLGFADRAMELDKEIEVYREKAKEARKQEEEEIIAKRMKVLHMAQYRKHQRLEFILAEETKQMNERFRKEEEKMLQRQEQEFLRVIENATRRAIGRVKKCNCPTPYTCRHNKTASYNTRRPTYLVVKYRRNAKRLKQAGRPEEAAYWLEKAKEIDEAEQESWRNRVAESIVSSPWGANEAAIDQITELHKKELAVLRKTHEVTRDMHKKKQAMRRKNFRNTMLAEERKVRMQCRKLAMLRVRKDYTKEQSEMKREQSIMSHSDGLKNVSKNLLGEELDIEEKKAVDWVPPTTFGLDNSVRLVDAVKEINPTLLVQGNTGELQGRIFTTKNDIKSLTQEQLRQKIHSVLKQDNSDEDSEESDEDEEEKDGEDKENLVYKLGETSGSKLVDTIRTQQEKREKEKEKEKNNMPSTPAPSTPAPSDATRVGGWTGFSPFPSSFPTSPGFPTSSAAGPTPSSPSPFAPPAFMNGTNASASLPFMNNTMNSSTAPVGGTNTGFGGFGGFPSSFPAATPTFPTAANAPNVPSAPSSFPTAPAPFPVPSSVPGSMPGTAPLTPQRPVVPQPVAPASPVPSQPSFRTNMFLHSPAPVAPATATAVSTLSSQLGNGNATTQHEEKNKPAVVKNFPAVSSDAKNEQGINSSASALPTRSPAPPQPRESGIHKQVALIDASFTDDHSEMLDGVEVHDHDEIAHPLSPRGGSFVVPTHTLAQQQAWKYDPVEDNKPIPFKPGSVRDEDWKAKDEEFARGKGLENSYGISLSALEEQTQRRRSVGGNASSSSQTAKTGPVVAPTPSPAPVTVPVVAKPPQTAPTVPASVPTPAPVSVPALIKSAPSSAGLASNLTAPGNNNGNSNTANSNNNAASAPWSAPANTFGANFAMSTNLSTNTNANTNTNMKTSSFTPWAAPSLSVSTSAPMNTSFPFGGNNNNSSSATGNSFASSFPANNPFSSSFGGASLNTNANVSANAFNTDGHAANNAANAAAASAVTAAAPFVAPSFASFSAGNTNSQGIAVSLPFAAPFSISDSVNKDNNNANTYTVGAPALPGNTANDINNNNNIDNNEISSVQSVNNDGIPLSANDNSSSTSNNNNNGSVKKNKNSSAESDVSQEKKNNPSDIELSSSSSVAQTANAVALPLPISSPVPSITRASSIALDTEHSAPSHTSHASHTDALSLASSHTAPAQLTVESLNIYGSESFRPIHQPANPAIIPSKSALSSKTNFPVNTRKNTSSGVTPNASAASLINANNSKQQRFNRPIPMLSLSSVNGSGKFSGQNSGNNKKKKSVHFGDVATVLVETFSYTDEDFAAPLSLTEMARVSSEAKREEEREEEEEREREREREIERERVLAVQREEEKAMLRAALRARESESEKEEETQSPTQTQTHAHTHTEREEDKEEEEDEPLYTHSALLIKAASMDREEELYLQKKASSSAEISKSNSQALLEGKITADDASSDVKSNVRITGMDIGYTSGYTSSHANAPNNETVRDTVREALVPTHTGVPSFDWQSSPHIAHSAEAVRASLGESGNNNPALSHTHTHTHTEGEMSTQPHAPTEQEMLSQFSAMTLSPSQSQSQPLSLTPTPHTPHIPSVEKPATRPVHRRLSDTSTATQQPLTQPLTQFAPQEHTFTQSFAQQFPFTQPAHTTELSHTQPFALTQPTHVPQFTLSMPTETPTDTHAETIRESAFSPSAPSIALSDSHTDTHTDRERESPSPFTALREHAHSHDDMHTHTDTHAHTQADAHNDTLTQIQAPTHTPTPTLTLTQPTVAQGFASAMHPSSPDLSGFAPFAAPPSFASPCGENNTYMSNTAPNQFNGNSQPAVPLSPFAANFNAPNNYNFGNNAAFGAPFGANAAPHMSFLPFSPVNENSSPFMAPATPAGPTGPTGFGVSTPAEGFSAVGFPATMCFPSPGPGLANVPPIVVRTSSVDEAQRSLTSPRAGTQDLSIMYSDTRSCSTEENTLRSQRQGPDWELCFFRLSLLSDAVQTLETALSGSDSEHDELLDCIELFLMTTSATWENLSAALSQTESASAADQESLSSSGSARNKRSNNNNADSVSSNGSNARNNNNRRPNSAGPLGRDAAARRVSGNNNNSNNSNNNNRNKSNQRQDVPESDIVSNASSSQNTGPRNMLSQRGGRPMALDTAEQREQVLLRLQLLRDWKRVQKDPSDSDGFVMACEDVLHIPHERLARNLASVLRELSPQLQSMLTQIAWLVMPRFVLSAECASYYESHSSLKSHNKKLRVDSKSWIGKFQKAVNAHSFPIHLFPFANTTGRPFANLRMRELFGPMCDAPSPREYFDASNDPQRVNEIIDAMKNGTNGFFRVKCRTIKADFKPDMMLALRHVRSSKRPDELKFSVVVLLDLSDPNAKDKKNILQAMMESIPIDNGSPADDSQSDRSHKL